MGFERTANIWYKLTHRAQENPKNTFNTRGFRGELSKLLELEFVRKSWKIESKSWLEANCSQCFFKFGLCVTTRWKIALINKKYKRMKLWWNSRNRFLIGRFKSLCMFVYSSAFVIDPRWEILLIFLPKSQKKKLLNFGIIIFL